MPLGKTAILFSGTGTTNTWNDRQISTLEYNKITVAAECVQLGSGVSVRIRGYPVAGFSPHIIYSGSITTSGDTVILTSGLTEAWEEMRVGIKSLQDNYSGAVSVFTAKKVK